jgi:hypothetical protein
VRDACLKDLPLLQQRPKEVIYATCPTSWRYGDNLKYEIGQANVLEWTVYEHDAD